MSIALGMIGLGVAAVYASIKCVQFVPLLKGDYKSGDHCTGSLIALVGSFILVIIYSLASKVWPNIPIPTPTPTPGPGNEPPPEEPPPEAPPVEIPPVEVIP